MGRMRARLLMKGLAFAALGVTLLAFAACDAVTVAHPTTKVLDCSGVTAISPEKWQHVADATYHVSLAYPDGWSTAAQDVADTGSQTPVQHAVFFLPPGSTQQAAANDTGDSSVGQTSMRVQVLLVERRELNPTTDPHYLLRGQRCVGNVAANFFVREDGYGGAREAAVARFGPDQHSYIFALSTPAATRTDDEAAFDSLLKSFEYK